MLGFALVGLFAGRLNTSISQNAFQNSRCIPQNVTINYAPKRERTQESTLPAVEPMPSWWVHQLNQTQLNKMSQAVVFDVVARSGNELWLAFYPDTLGNPILRYRTDTGDIKAYGVSGQPGKWYVAGNLFVTHDGNLWARLITEQEYSMLARYNPQTDEFKIVTDQGNLLLPPKNIKITWGSRTQPVLDESPDGNLVMALK